MYTSKTNFYQKVHIYFNVVLLFNLVQTLNMFSCKALFRLYNTFIHRFGKLNTSRALEPSLLWCTFNVEQTKELHILNNSAACSNVRIENVKTIVKITAHHIIFTFFLLCWEKGGNNRKYSHEKLHFRVHFLRFE